MLAVILMLASLTVSFTFSARARTYLSPSAIVAAHDQQTLFVACATANEVLVYHPEQAKIKSSIKMPASPSGLVLSADGQYLYVTCAAPESQVCIVDVRAGKIIGTISAGHTASSPVLSPDGKTLYVCNQFNNNVSVIDLAARKEVRRIEVQREPVAADITKDGRYLLVANHLSNTASDLKFVGAIVSMIDLAAGRVVKELQLPSGSEMLKDIKVSPDGKHAVVTHVFCNYDLPTTRVELGLINANAMTIINLSNLEILYTFLLDTPYSGAANPWGVAFSEDGNTLAVAHAGTHEVSVIHFPSLLTGLPKIDRKSPWPTNESTMTFKFVPHYEDEELNDGLPYLVGARERVKLPDTDLVPRAIAFSGHKIYTANRLSDTLSVIDLDAVSPRQAQSLPLGRRQAMDETRKGELYFYDARLCYQGWQSCSSCHPGDGRVDALNWDLVTDGLGNPRNTKSILLAYKVTALEKPVAGATNQMGGGASAGAATRVALKFLFFTNQPESVAVALDKYLASLRPVPSPYLVHGQLSEAAQHGKGVFATAGCINCHVPGLYSDDLPHNVGTGAPYDGASPKFYTPTLVEAWRTAPYLHNGHAATIRDVLTTANPNDGRHGNVSELSPAQIDDLCAYVLSL